MFKPAGTFNILELLFFLFINKTAYNIRPTNNLVNCQNYAICY